MKPKKLSLKQLNVDSFVTSLQNKKTNTVKGGTWETTIIPITISIYYSVTYYTQHNDCISKTTGNSVENCASDGKPGNCL